MLWKSTKKETLGLLNHRRNKYIKQRGHHSIFELIRKKKRRVVIGLFIDLGLIDSIFSLFSFIEKREFHCKAVCNAQKMPVRLFNSIFFSYYSLAILPVSLCELEEPFIMLYHQGNDPSTR